jgi:hypothetical protein
MTHDPVTDPRAFEALMQDLNHPLVRFGRRKVAGIADWQPVFDGPIPITPIEQRAALRQLERPLLQATPDGIERLKRWEDTPEPAPIPAGELKRWVDHRLLAFGDLDIVERIIHAVMGLPAYARGCALTDGCWLAVGSESLAWTSRNKFADRNGYEPPRLVVVGPHASARTIRHEAAHLWLDAPAIDSMKAHQAIPAQGERDLRVYAESAGLLGRLDEATAQRERAANALAWVWGDLYAFPPSGVTS